MRPKLQSKSVDFFQIFLEITGLCAIHLKLMVNMRFKL